MKFSEFVLSEGRRETLFDKYSDAFSVEQLDYLLNNDFIKKTNYKYADFILDRLVKFYNLTPGTAHIQDAINVVKEFDRLGKNLDKKDINQYQSLGELSLLLKDYTSKSQEKKIDSDANKIYEDGRVLIVRPLSHKASCKYGAGTKWCTTQSSPGYFDKYTSGNNQLLYYIIMKDFDIKNKFYKIALHIGPSGEQTWYDALDIAMPPREIDLLKVGLGKRAYNKLIEDISNKDRKDLNEFFNPKYRYRIHRLSDFLGSKKSLFIEFTNANIISDGVAEINLNIYFDEEKVEQGTLLVNYKSINGNEITVDIKYILNPTFPSKINSDLSKNLNINLDIILSPTNSDDIPFRRFCMITSNYITGALLDDENVKKYFYGHDKIWFPNRRGSGYTFKNSKLMKKLVDYIDSGKEGNAIDFLIDSGKITTRKLNDGTIEYIGKRGPIIPRGYLSGFFASAVNAGILSYVRKNKKNILSKGKNFEAFKEGKLKSI